MTNTIRDVLLMGLAKALIIDLTLLIQPIPLFRDTSSSYHIHIRKDGIPKYGLVIRSYPQYAPSHLALDKS